MQRTHTHERGLMAYIIFNLGLIAPLSFSTRLVDVQANERQEARDVDNGARPS